jgi:hypothetical protein
MFGKSESGQALVIALILLAVGSLLVIPVLSHVFTNLNYNQLIECRTLNDYAADAGIQYVTCMIYNNPGTTGLSENLTINGRTVSVSTEYMGGGLFAIVSTASGGGCGKTTIRSFVNLSVGSFAYVIGAKSAIALSNCIVDSLPTPGNADIYSNGNISILGTSSLVNGDAYAVGLVTKGKDKIAGVVTEGADPLQFPSVYAALYKQMAMEGGTYNGNLTLTGTQHIGPLYINGQLDVKPGAMIILDGPLYVTGLIKVTGGHLDGEEHVYTENNIQMSGGGYGSESIPVMVSINGTISLVGPIVDAVIYAPVNTVTLTNLQLFGAVGGNVCNIGNAIIRYSESLHGRSDLPGSELYPLTYTYD